MVIGPAFRTFGSVGSCQVKWNQHLHKACQQKEAWSALKLTVNFRKHSGPTPADDRAGQITIDCGNFTLDFKQNGYYPLVLQTLGPWFPQEMQNLLSSEKRTLDQWATVQLFFSLAHVRCFWYCFCFRSGLVALFLKTSQRGDALPPASVHSLWRSPKCLNQLYLTVFSSLWSSLLLVHIFLSNFFLPVNFEFNIIWCSTLSKATPFSNEPLWFTLFVESVSDLWTTVKSAVFPIIVVSKNKLPGIYTVGMVIYWNSNVNILIFWDTDVLTLMSCKL